MKKIISVFILLALMGGVITPAFAALTGDAETDSIMLDNKVLELSNKYLAVLSTLYPEDATQVGVSGYHSSLAAKDKQEQLIRAKTMQGLKDALGRIDVKKLSTERQVDYYILLEIVNKNLFDINVLKQAQNDPSWYLESLDAVYELLLKDFIPPADRVRDALKRLQNLPAVFVEGKRNVENPPDLRLRLAIDKAASAYASFGELSNIFNKLAVDEYTKEEGAKAIEAVKESVRDYHAYLKELMLSKTYVDFRLGKEAFNDLYTNVYEQSVPLKKFPKALDREVEKSRSELSLALTPIIEPTFTEAERAQRTNKKGLIEIYPADYYKAKESFKKYVPVKDILKTYAKLYPEAVEFFNTKKFFPAPSLEVLLARAPKYLESKLTRVTYWRPYPLINKAKGDLLVTIPTAEDIKANTAKMYTEGDIKFSVASYMTPGKQLLYSYTAEDGPVLKRVSNDMFFVNGWEKYSLNLAAEAGYLSTPEDMLNLAWYNYKKALLATVDYNMQTMEFNYTQSLEYLTSNGLKKEEAEAELDYVAVNPLSAISSLLGQSEFDKLRVKYQKKLGKKFNLQDYHKRLLSVGRAPLHIVGDAVDRTYEEKTVESFFNTTYF